MAAVKCFRSNCITFILPIFIHKNNVYPRRVCAFKFYPKFMYNSSCFCRYQHSSTSTTTLAAKEREIYSEESSENKFITMRTHTCGALNENNVDSLVSICGWLQFSRMSRFAILRDGYGVTQVVIPDERKDLSQKLVKVPLESVVSVKGRVIRRPTGQENLKMPTGLIEVLAEDIIVLNSAKKDMPFSIREFNKAKESLQMKYRYLSLRFPELQQNLRLRSHIVNLMREFLIRKCAFVEVETPTLFRKTPGGAQEFVVPTQNPGHFYSLVQSPQQLKQMLMVGAIDRYFQVARCYRDETARPDRQPEFTQMDIEMSFADREGIIELVEELLVHSWCSTIGKTDQPPFPKITYYEAIAFYGSDKPDTRFEMKLTDVTKILLTDGRDSKISNHLKKDSSYVAACFVVNKSMDQGFLSKNNFKKFEVLKRSSTKMPSICFLAEKLSNENEIRYSKNFQKMLSVGIDDWIVSAAGKKEEVLPFLGRLRLSVADHLESNGVKVRADGFHFLWVKDFPLFLTEENASKEVVLESAHHPFTQPHPDDLHLLEQQPLKVRGLHYDLVCNGCEVGGGSVRVHDSVLQCSILDLLKIDKSSLNHLIEALQCGCPPHAGIALGIDRLISLAVGAESVREVIAFPKGSDGQDIMSGAPSHLTQQELDLYHLNIRSSAPEK